MSNLESNFFSSSIQPNHIEEYLMEEKLKEGMFYVIVGDQMLNSYREMTTKMGLDSIASTNIFSPRNSIGNVLQGVTHEHIHKEVTFILGHGE